MPFRSSGIPYPPFLLDSFVSEPTKPEKSQKKARKKPEKPEYRKARRIQTI
jgi:hypothetical protein